MSWFIEAIITGTSAFIATNLDDIFVLMFLFSQLSSNLRIWQIISGQYLGFTLLILASLPGFFGGLFIPETWIGLLGFLPITIGVFHLLKSDQNSDETIQLVSIQTTKLSRLLNPQVYGVAAITIANGGDNIGIYIPLFAKSNLLTLIVILVVFYTLIGLWCYVSYSLAHHPMIAKFLNYYGHKLVPFILIVLGIYILLDSHSYQLLPFL